MESCDTYSQKIICFIQVNIIHGHLNSLLMHRSTLSMDTNSHFSNKVTLSADNTTLFMHRLTLSMDTNSQFSCTVILSMDNVNRLVVGDECEDRIPSRFPAIHKIHTVCIFVQLLMEINWKKLRA